MLSFSLAKNMLDRRDTVSYASNPYVEKGSQIVSRIRIAGRNTWVGHFPANSGFAKALSQGFFKKNEQHGVEVKLGFEPGSVCMTGKTSERYKRVYMLRFSIGDKRTAFGQQLSPADG